MSENPYQTPDLTNLPVEPSLSSDAVAIRQMHLSNEASIKGLGTLYILGGGLGILGALGLLLAIVISLTGAGSHKADPSEIGIFVLYLALGPLYLVTGLAMRKLKPWARIVGIVFSAIGLLGFPFGTLICAYLLYLLAGKKGSFIFTPAYQEILALTPGMKYKTSIIVWIVLGVVILLVALGLVFIFARGTR